MSSPSDCRGPVPGRWWWSFLAVALWTGAAAAASLSPGRVEPDRLVVTAIDSHPRAPSVADAEQPQSIPAADVADSPPLRLFVPELARNFGSLFARRNLAPLLIGAAATAGVSRFDGDVEEYFADGDRLATAADAGDRVGGPLVTGGLVGAALLAGRLTDNHRFRSFTYSLAQGWVINKALVAGLKASIHRERPDRRNDNSFPSGHETSAMMIAAMLHQYYGAKAGVPGYAYAAFIGFSRLEGGDHHVSDLSAGATLGYLIARSVSARALARQDASHFSLDPLLLPEGAGAQVTLRW